MQIDSADVAVKPRSYASISAGLLSVALYVLLVAPIFVFSAIGGQGLGRVIWPGLSPLFHGVSWIAGVFVVTWIMRVRVNREPWSGMALPRPQVLRLLLGAAGGVAAILVAAAVEYQMGWLHIARIDTEAHRGLGKSLWLVLELLPSLAVGLSEELAFRGYVFRTLGERMPVWVAALLMSLVFAALHFSLSGFGVTFVLSVTITSLTLLMLRFASGSLWLPIGFHGAWDWTQTYLVGLSTAGRQGYDPALAQVRQTGPSFWVGNGQAIEAGALFMLIELIVLGLALLYTAVAGRRIAWMCRLD